MSASEICKRLSEHSGLPVDAPQLHEGAFFDGVEAVRKGQGIGALRNAADDVIECLDQLNNQLQTEPGRREEILNASLAYAVSGMLTQVLEVSIQVAIAG